MTYEQALGWMFAQLPMYQQKGISALNNKLENIQNFSAHLENPHQKFKSIHIAGTNGKGSSCHMLASILQEAGYRVGLYTSPHLKDFRERIKINGVPISESKVVDFIVHHNNYLKKNRLSFFEMTVGMAFDYFATEQVDIAVVEVGLGGRLDSTNIIMPEVCLITNIGFDHQHILGDTLEKIAFEKAGIIKDGVPVIISETQSETQTVFLQVAESKNATIFFADKQKREHYKTDLLGKYQRKNILGVLACLNALKGFQVKPKAIKDGLMKVSQTTGLLGRWQILKERPFTVCDTAHNREGLVEVLHQIKQHDFEKLHLVLGFVEDKDLTTMLPLFPKNGIYYWVSPNVPRGLKSNVAKKIGAQYELFGDAYTTVREGLKVANKASSTNDFIFVGGSTFVVAEVV